jgi:uncharacterized protein
VRVRAHSVEGFLSRAGPWLLEAEAEHNLMLGIARRIAGAGSGEEAPFFATLEERGHVVGCAFRTPPRQLGVTRMPAGGAAVLADALERLYPSLPGVGGPPAAARGFADEWVGRRGGGWSIRFESRLYRLTDVDFPKRRPAGLLRPAVAADAELARRWVAAFVADTGIGDDTVALADHLVGSGGLYFWDDGGPTAMVASTRDTPNGAAVNAVYTPPEARGCGYATIAVATLSQRLLDAGYRFCCLYADTVNLGPARIYQRIGYRPIADAIEIDFT